MTIQDKQILVQRASKTVYRSGDEIIKEFVPGYAKSAVLKEAFNHALAEETGLPVPELLAVTSVNGGWSLVIRAVEGRTMAQAMAEEPEKLEQYMEQFVDIQSMIHKASC
ncbi:MAG: aminoglycoside phosphotransferase, partial [Clostridia bacterium]|nr:aminoglycoside phosphotransferase [Clostridia bacterium]